MYAYITIRFFSSITKETPPSRCICIIRTQMIWEILNNTVMKMVGLFLSPSHSTSFPCNYFVLHITCHIRVTFGTCMGMEVASLRVPQVFLQHWIEIREGGGGQGGAKITQALGPKAQNVRSCTYRVLRRFRFSKTKIIIINVIECILNLFN